MRHIEADLRKYDGEKTKSICVGYATVPFCDAKNAWISLGGKSIHSKADAEKYAVKLSNFMTGLSV
jgi:hypothetical protein